MTSPFKTYQEFSEAEGAIYTFANNPAMIGILLILCTAILLYFIYMSYTMKQTSSSPSSASLGALLLASALSLAGLTQTSHAPRHTPEATKRQPSAERTAKRTLQPLALFGMVGIGTTAFKRERNRKSRSLGRRSARRSTHN